MGRGAMFANGQVRPHQSALSPRELGREKRAEEELDLREFKRRKRSREDGGK